MSVSFTLHDVSLVADRVISPQEATKMLTTDTALSLSDAYSNSNPEDITISLINGVDIGIVPSGIAIEIRELTSNFEELSAHIEKVVRTNGLYLDIDICLSDFSWDNSGAFPVIILTSNNSSIKPAKGTFRYDIYQSKLKLLKLKKEEEILNSQYRSNRFR